MAGDVVLSKDDHDRLLGRLSAERISGFVALATMSLFVAQSSITLATLLSSTDAAVWWRQSALSVVEILAALGCAVGVVARWRTLTKLAALVVTLDLWRALVLGGPLGWDELRGDAAPGPQLMLVLPRLGALAMTWWLALRARQRPGEAGSHSRWRGNGVMPIWLANGPLLTIGAFEPFDLDPSTCIALAGALAILYIAVLAYPGSGSHVQRAEWSLGSLILLGLFLPDDVANLIDHYGEDGTQTDVALFSIELIIVVSSFVVLAVTNRQVRRTARPAE